MARLSRCLLALLASLILSNCTTPTGVTPKPDVAPVKQSNRQIQVSAKKLHESTQQVEKLNRGILTEIDKAIGNLDQLLQR